MNQKINIETDVRKNLNTIKNVNKDLKIIAEQ